jgi:NADH-quinone oxidoreductase subunit J
MSFNWSLMVFFILAGISVGSALLVVANRNPVRSALFLVVNFFVLAIFFLTLSAQFIAAVQVIVYAGAIMVLFLFVIMLLNLGAPEALKERGGLQMPVAIMLAVVFISALGLAGSLTTGLRPSNATPATVDGSPYFTHKDILLPADLARKLRTGADPATAYLRDQIHPESRVKLMALKENEAPSLELISEMKRELNRLVDGPVLFETQRFSSVRLSNETQKLLNRQSTLKDRKRINRLLLQDVFPEEITKSEQMGSVETVGKAMFDAKKPWLLPFELTSILLLVGIVGSVVLAKRRG